MDRAVEICTGLSPWIRDQALTGSRAILSVTHPESDLDIAILAKSIHEYLQRIVPYLEVREWKADGSKPKPGTEFNLAPFHSWSKDKVNLIITESEDHFKRIVAATDLARRYCLKDKRERIILFHAVLYGDTAAKTLGDLEKRETERIQQLTGDPDNLLF